ncbi:porphobilinogen synthase [Flavobacteriales bacterium]|nr:porphobilinogen synthase [Flavobacteriales bacterium]
MFPDKRNRRLRKNQSIRDMVQENRLHPSDFIVPLFFMEGQNTKEEIASMPGYYRYTLDLLVDEVKSCYDLGIRSALLFAKVEDSLKDNEGKEAVNPKGLMQKAIRLLKKEIPEMYLMSDVALDPYSIHGHDGIVDGEEILNDETLDVLAEMAVSHAEAGVDMVAPSDMMDGRIGIIRESLENEGFPNVGIMSYSVKYASNYYGPFRDALESTPGFGDKKTYQMNPANALEGLSEVERDIEEGADILMIKPGQPYLDMVRLIRDSYDLTISAYQVSGEYAMIKAASEKGWLNHDKVMMESLIGFKRAGANLIATYFAKEAAKLLKNEE